MNTTTKIYDFISQQERAVTLRQIQEALNIRVTSIPGFLNSLLKSGKLVREKTERVSGTGPKTQWVYKCVASTQQN
jgi:predicted transcriptional regulator